MKVTPALDLLRLNIPKELFEFEPFPDRGEACFFNSEVDLWTKNAFHCPYALEKYNVLYTNGKLITSGF